MSTSIDPDGDRVEKREPEFKSPSARWGLSRSALIAFVAFDVVIAAAVVGYFVFMTSPDEQTLVVYCTHDAVYSQEIIDRFSEETGLNVEVVHDDEKTKSLGLLERLKAERENPRCHVFWNNELLGTLELEEAELLEPYKGSGWARMPDGMKAADGAWTGMGARMRVVIVNTEKMVATQEAVDAAMAGELDRFAIAKALYGTTLTHYTVLWEHLGGDGLKALHAERLERGMKVVDGNGKVKDLAAEGVLDFGWTDTDDFFSAVDAGKPVAMVPVRVEGDGRVIVIPNTLALIKGAFETAEQRAMAERFVDYVLSAKAEERLAETARQVPLGAVDESKLPDEVKALRGYLDEAYPLTGLGEARDACLGWLKEMYTE